MNRYRACSLKSLVLGLLAASFVVAEEFAVDWTTIDGGGGIISSGEYVLGGTVGQPDAAPVLAGGPFELQAGFWANGRLGPAEPPPPGTHEQQDVQDPDSVAGTPPP